MPPEALWRPPSRALGAGDRGAERLLWHVIALALVGALLFLLLFALFGPAFLAFPGGRGEVLERAVAYCVVLFGGGVFVWLMGTISADYRGTGNMRFPAMLLIASAFLQVPLSGVLVLGAFGAPPLGIVGAAISAVSAVSAAGLSSVIMLWRLTGDSQSVRPRWSACRFSAGLYRDLLRVFAPASRSPLLTVATILSLTAIVAGFGPAALAGYGIGSRIEFLIVPLVFGLGAAMTSLVGLATGAADHDRAERIGWNGAGMAAVLAGSVGVLLALFPGAWVPAFTADPDAQTAAISYMRTVGPFFALQGVGLSLYFASQGAGAMLWPVLATFARILVAVGGALLLAHVLGWGLQGIFVAAAVAMVLYGLVIALAVKLGPGVAEDRFRTPSCSEDRFWTPNCSVVLRVTDRFWTPNCSVVLRVTGRWESASELAADCVPVQLVTFAAWKSEYSHHARYGVRWAYSGVGVPYRVPVSSWESRIQR